MFAALIDVAALCFVGLAIARLAMHSFGFRRGSATRRNGWRSRYASRGFRPGSNRRARRQRLARRYDYD